MNEAPKGKIGRLPKALQEQVNHRLENGEKARTIVAWLNTLPEVQTMLSAEFAGKPIREQNLSEWRQHGYRKWLEQRQCLAMAREMNATPAPPVTDHLAGWATAHYLYAINKLIQTKAGGPLEFETLRTFLHDVVAVRRGDHSAIRLQLVSVRRAAVAERQLARAGLAAAADTSPLAKPGNAVY